jgi:hypothetical protein
MGDEGAAECSWHGVQTHSRGIHDTIDRVFYDDGAFATYRRCWISRLSRRLCRPAHCLALDGHGASYTACNVPAAALAAISLIAEFNLPSALIQASTAEATIALAAIAFVLRQRRVAPSAKAASVFNRGLALLHAIGWGWMALA